MPLGINLKKARKAVQSAQRFVVDERKFVEAYKRPSLKNIAGATFEGVQLAATFTGSGAAARLAGKAALRGAASKTATKAAAKRFASRSTQKNLTPIAYRHLVK